MKAFFFAVFIFLIFVDVTAQDTIIKRNVLQMKRMEEYIKAICDSVQTNGKNKRIIAIDKKRIDFMNIVFSGLDYYSEFLKKANNEGLIQSKKYDAGLMSIITFEFKKKVGYLNIVLSLTTINDRIIYKKIGIQTFSKMSCFSTKEVLSWVADFAYIDKEILRFIKFPIQTCPNCIGLSSDSLNKHILRDLGKEIFLYHFSFDNVADSVSERILGMMYKNINAYSRYEASTEMTWLIKQKQYRIIEDLLYAPNYIVALDAYEALTYLKLKKNVNIQPVIAAKMLEVLNKAIPVREVCGHDCTSNHPSYNSMNIKEDDILNKYSVVERTK
ncbi:MAG: hypothetical protein QM731_09915 [Chitinophagaceae bacterium]